MGRVTRATKTPDVRRVLFVPMDEHPFNDNDEAVNVRDLSVVRHLTVVK